MPTPDFSWFKGFKISDFTSLFYYIGNFMVQCPMCDTKLYYHKKTKDYQPLGNWCEPIQKSMENKIVQHAEGAGCDKKMDVTDTFPPMTWGMAYVSDNDTRWCMLPAIGTTPLEHLPLPQKSLLQELEEEENEPAPTEPTAPTTTTAEAQAVPHIKVPDTYPYKQYMPPGLRESVCKAKQPAPPPQLQPRQPPTPPPSLHPPPETGSRGSSDCWLEPVYNLRGGLTTI